LRLGELRSLLERVDPRVARMPGEILREFSRSEEGRAVLGELSREATASRVLPERMRPHWERIAAWVVPYDVSLLETALELESAKAARTKLVHQFWSRRPTLVSRVEALRDARAFAHGRRLLFAHLLDELVPAPEDAARAFVRAEAQGGPRELRITLALAVVEAVEREPGAAAEPSIASALRQAHRLLERGRRKRKKQPEASAKKAKRGREPRLVQTWLPFEPDKARPRGPR
jgi:hypothetical protein